MTQLSDEAVGRVVHEATAALKIVLGERDLMPHWDEAPQSMRDLSTAAVRFRRENPTVPVGAQHLQWVSEREDAGWTRGPVKDLEKKTHPLLVPFEELPREERLKNEVIVTIVDTLSQRAKP